ncbi:MAG: 4-hydroxy-tetrahydrodipicolinate synthase [Cyclobacteriaceae bacterium]
MSSSMFRGTGVALITPFKEDYSIDFESLKKVLSHVSDDVDYLVILGTTGEAPTLSAEEKNQITEFVIEHNIKKLPLVYGLGGNSTQWVLDQIDIIKDYPIDAILSLSPYYNKPSQEGIIKHYTTIADASPFPIILYNVPARTSSNITADTTLKLSNHPNIIGTKEASGNLMQCMEILKNVPEEFLLISGDDALTLPMMSFGCAGAISVIANLQPKDFSEMVRKAANGQYEDAAKLHYQMLEGYELVGAEGNPVSVKCGLNQLGVISSQMRLPLVPGTPQLEQSFREYLK